jgi:cytochrome c
VKRVLGGVATVAVTMILLAAPRSGGAQDADRGKELFEKRCTGCHALDNDKEGPRLRGVYGRKSGAIESFNYSDALKRAGIPWDAASLDLWLADPEKLVPDNDMAFRLVKADERTAIIAYLKELSSK